MDEFAYDLMWDAAERHWPALVNRERTTLYQTSILKEQRRWWGPPEGTPPAPDGQSIEYEGERVGNYLMAYDPIRDALYLFDHEVDDPYDLV